MKVRQKFVGQPHKNTAPINPIAAVSHGVCPNFSAIWIPGASSDQKLAAIMTPAANPSMESSSFRLIVVVKKPATHQPPSPPGEERGNKRLGDRVKLLYEIDHFWVPNRAKNSLSINRALF